MEYYSAMKRNTFETILMRRINPEHFVQSEEVRKRKASVLYCVDPEGKCSPPQPFTLETTATTKRSTSPVVDLAEGQGQGMGESQGPGAHSIHFIVAI